MRPSALLPIIVSLSMLSVSLWGEMRQSVEQLFNVQTIKAKKESSSSSEKNHGFVVIDQSRSFDITPRFGGYVVKLYANKLYQKVKKGDPLVTVYSPEILKAKEEYLNSYLYASKGSSKGMMESAKRKLELLGVDSKEIRTLMNKKVSRASNTIYAPMDAYIFSKEISEGSAFHTKQRLFTLVNLDQVWVEVRLRQEQIEDLEKVDHYEISLASGEKIYQSKKALLYPYLDKKEALMTLRLEVDNPEHKLFPGMYAEVKSVRNSQDFLVLPATAVIRKNGTFYVFMSGEFEGEYLPTEVQVKPLDRESYIIESGLKEGDEVVNNALFMMDSDAQINGLY